MSYQDILDRHANRLDWDFEYTAKLLAEAAAKKAQYRSERERWWHQAKARVMAEIRESGIEVSESVASSYSNTGLRGPQVMVKSDLQSKLGECHQKIIEHNGAARDYRGWVQMLNANPEARLKLRHADWLYFFGDDAVLNPDTPTDDD